MDIKNFQDCGRTMIEMLGVLTIVGLLSLGGFQWYSGAFIQVQKNNLLDEVRKRAIASRPKSAKVTYGMFDKKGSVSGVTSYGYGIAGNTETPNDEDPTEKYKIVLDNMVSYYSDPHTSVFVPVGTLNGGNAITPGLCKSLLNQVNKTKDRNKIGDLLGLWYGIECKRRLSKCEAEDETESYELPSVICLEIKS